ncbi:MAG: hypothetical protein OXN17_20000 [Candidatus Poribacteria bacterium]|nr:hypothetical protein [Candidatus Poribacteria bacterium]MDE0505534.1 hypothetical protein [Candidatus Poribacteria bacterium]
MKRFCYTGILGVLLVLCGSLLGCLAQMMQQGTGGSRLVDYALSENGATVSASRSTANHRPETAINGIISSENWGKGEGWEAEFERRNLKDNWRNWQWDTSRAEARGGAWIEVGFPEPKRVNRIVIHTLDSDKFPASKYGIHSGALRVWTGDRWETIALVKNGKVEYTKTNPIRSVAGGKIEFRFPMMSIGRVKFIVLRSNDRKIAGKSLSTVTERSAARIVEIEVTGSESIDEVVRKPESIEPEDELDAIMQ